MTIIVAAKDEPNNCVWIGSDGLATRGSIVISFNHKKYIINGDRAVATCGCEFYDKALYQFINDEEFPDSLPRLAKDWIMGWTNNQPQKFSNSLPMMDGSSIIVNGMNMYTMDSIFNLHQIDKVVVDGCGHEIALGAWEGYAGLNIESRIHRTIEAVCKWNVDCGGEIFVDKIGRD